MLHTINPDTDTTDQAVRAYLATVDDKPIRYRAADGTIRSTTACRWRTSRYVLIDTQPSGAVTVAAVRSGFRSLGTLTLAREPARLAAPFDDTPEATDAYSALLSIYVGMCLDDLTDQADQ